VGWGGVGWGGVGWGGVGWGGVGWGGVGWGGVGATCEPALVSSLPFSGRAHNPIGLVWLGWVGWVAAHPNYGQPGRLLLLTAHLVYQTLNIAIHCNVVA
jgi:hypothetical protein